MLFTSKVKPDRERAKNILLHFRAFRSLKSDRKNDKIDLFYGVQGYRIHELRVSKNVAIERKKRLIECAKNKFDATS